MKKILKNKNHQPPFILLILDGWGVAPPNKGNAIELAKKPNFDFFWNHYPHTLLQASDGYVGLPLAQHGNSEAGHMNLGAGRLVEQDAVRISREINTGQFFKNPAFTAACQHIKKNKSDLHLMGMLATSQSAHADPDHLLALLACSRIHKIKNVYLHLFTDGRDSPPHASLKLVEALIRQLKNKGNGHRSSGEWIATLMGRFYAMDRKKEWPRTEAAYNAMVLGKGLAAKSPQAAITQAYNRGETDEFIPPYVMKRNGEPLGKIKDGDAVIFFNLRSDRARQLAKAFVQTKFNSAANSGAFVRKKVLHNLAFVAMTDFGPDLDAILSAFPALDLVNTLPPTLAGYRQLYLAEKEKYAHVTYFFNGGYTAPLANEDWLMVPSPAVDSYDQVPAMSVNMITEKVLHYLPDYNFMTVNFANADMVGHTGNLPACIKAVEAVDVCLGKVAAAVKKRHGTLIITADHGNAEKMIDLKTGEVYTEHTSNPVPFILVEPKRSQRRLKKGKLGDVAPTILKLMNLPRPREMTGKSLY